MGRSLPPNWNSIRRAVFKRDSHTCANCGRNGENDSIRLHVHHIVPRKSGGTHRLSNLKTLCEQCHYAVHFPNVLAPTSEKVINYDRFLNIMQTPPELLSDPDQEYLSRVSGIIEQFSDKKDRNGHEFYPFPEKSNSTSERGYPYDTKRKTDSERWKDLRAKWSNKP